MSMISLAVVNVAVDGGGEQFGFRRRLSNAQTHRAKTVAGCAEGERHADGLRTVANRALVEVSRRKLADVKAAHKH